MKIKLSYLLGLLLIPLTLSFGVSAKAGANSQLQVLTRIKAVHRGEVKVESASAPLVRFRLKDASLEQELAKLEKDDEALLMGYLFYQQEKDSSRISTIFVIEEIRLVSLRRLGKAAEAGKMQEQTITLQLNQNGYYPVAAIGLNSSVVNSMTISASVLLLNNLAKQPATEPAVRDSLKTGVLFSTAILATGYFIWEQLQGKTD